MTDRQRSTLFTALSVSTMMLTLNIIAVTSGLADSYYAEIQRWLTSLLS